MEILRHYSEYYKPLLSQFCNDIVALLPAENFHGIPHPFIPAWGKRYMQSTVKMAVVGLETRGWNPELPEYITDVLKNDWESSFDVSEFQNLDYVEWNRGHRYTFWGFVMYFLAALYGVKNWEILKQRKREEILNCFAWGNVTAIERWESTGIPEETDKAAWKIARKMAIPLNDFQHMKTTLAPEVVIIMCNQHDCNQYLRNTSKELIYDENGIRYWKSGDIHIFNMPHPNRMKFEQGADFYAQQIRNSLEINNLFLQLDEFMDCDKEAELMLSNFFSHCRAKNTKEAVAFIATELRKQDAKMTVRLLCSVLNKLGYRTTYGTEYSAGRGSYKMVAGAWLYYKNKGEDDIAENIALAFTKPNGDYAYWNY